LVEKRANQKVFAEEIVGGSLVTTEKLRVAVAVGLERTSGEVRWRANERTAGRHLSERDGDEKGEKCAEDGE
jgi:hypothetical protein